MKRIILGITGLHGSGKSTVARYLEEQGFLYLSARYYFSKELKKRAMEINRENMRLVANDLRSSYGSSYLMSEIKKDINNNNKDIVIESLRTVNEVNQLISFGGTLLLTTAPTNIRYQRAVARNSETDKVSFEEFIEAESRESQSENPDIQNLTKVAEMAHYRIENNDFKSFKSDIDKLIETLRAS